MSVFRWRYDETCEGRYCCGDCDKCDKEDEEVDDLISRQAAISWVKANCNPYGAPIIDYDSGLKVMEHLKKMPTAEKMGKWEIEVDCEYDIFDIAGERTWAIKAKCSECDFAMRFIEGHGMFNYCPNCGARMEE